MTIETASYINQLNTAYPRSTDLLKEGDDHIRMIKNTLKQTFPRIDKAVNINSDTLNSLATNIVGTSTGIRVNGDFTMASGKAVNFGGNRLQGAGRPTDVNGFNSMDHGEVMTFGHMRSLMRMMYPKGSLFITNGINPGNLIFFAGTSWNRHWPGRYLMSSNSEGGSSYWDPKDNASFGVSNGYHNDDGYGFQLNTGNLPGHTHSGRTDNQGYNQGTSGVGDHQHYEGISIPSNLGTIWGAQGLPRDVGNGIAAGGNHLNQGAWTSPAGSHAHTIDWTHSHGFTTNGGDGVANSNINYAPAAFGVAVFIRVDDNGVSV